MKRMSFAALLCSFLYISNVCALPTLPTYEMDAATAAGMRDLGFSGGGDSYTLAYVGYNPGTNPAFYPVGDKVYGSWANYGDLMYYSVGFAGSMHAGETDPTGWASLTIGLYDSGPSLGLSGMYDGFLLPLSNDDDDVWSYQAYIIYNLGAGEVTVDSGTFVDLNPDTQTDLFVSTPGLDYSKVVGIGFTIKWLNINNPDGAGGYRTGDEYHTSVVPVPGALLLTLIGLGSLRLKFRR